MKRIVLFVLLSAMIFSGCATATPSPAPAPAPAPMPKVVEIKALNPFNYGQEWKDFLRVNYVDKVVARAGGEIKINWVGGPEVIPGAQQPDAIRTGAIDMIFTCLPIMQSHFSQLAPVWLSSKLISWRNARLGSMTFMSRGSKSFSMHDTWDVVTAKRSIAPSFQNR